MSVQLDVAAMLARHPLEWSVEDQGLVYEETVGLSYVGHAIDIVPALATALRAALADQRRIDWLAANYKRVDWLVSPMYNGGFMIHNSLLGWVLKPTLRDAIDFGISDAAMTADGGGV